MMKTLNPLQQNKKEPRRGLLYLYRCLIVVALLLALILLGGTLYALIFRSPAEPATGQSPVIQGNPAGGTALPTESIFSGIGKIRTATALPEAATVILSIAFPYNPQDKSFSEELASRVRDFRDITTGYFGALSIGEVRNQSEGNLKAALLERYNAVLRLGRIETLYFNDYMIIE